MMGGGGTLLIEGLIFRFHTRFHIRTHFCADKFFDLTIPTSDEVF